MQQSESGLSATDRDYKLENPDPQIQQQSTPPAAAVSVPEIGGRQGPEPTRFGDWERNGRCIDF